MAFNYARIYNDMGYKEQLEKRQLFLRSYQFSRKQTVAERIKKSFFKVKKVIFVRLKSARKLRKILCFRIKISGLFVTSTSSSSRRRRSNFLRHNYNYNYCRLGSSYPMSSCFC